MREPRSLRSFIARRISGGSLKVVRAIPTLRRLVRSARGPVVLVPTMGALHVGHAALLRRARRLAGREGLVVASIFVNPTQFGPKEDFSRYPRTLAADRRLCATEQTDVIFAPEATEMYAPDFSTWVNEESVSGPLCGTTRPGHFRGVCTVVLKLFQVVQPQSAVFGLKDFQQCMVIRRMVRDLNVPVRIIAIPTVREADGLALSSRNRHLSPAERAQAAVLQRALRAAQAAFAEGATSSARLRKIVVKVIATAPLARLEYAELCEADTLQPARTVRRGCVILLAVFFGNTRLIDNHQLA